MVNHGPFHNQALGCLSGIWDYRGHPLPAGYPGTSIHHANFGHPGFAQGHGQGIILIYRRMAQLKASGPTDWFAPMISLAVVCCASFIDRSRKMRNQFERQRAWVSSCNLNWLLQPCARGDRRSEEIRVIQGTIRMIFLLPSALHESMYSMHNGRVEGMYPKYHCFIRPLSVCSTCSVCALFYIAGA